MGWSLRVARIAGIEVKIHLTFLLLLAWLGFAYYLQGGAAAAVEGLLFIILFFSCVLLHEFGHALAARRYGIATPDIMMHKELPTVYLHTPFEEAFTLMQESGSPVLPVLDERERLVGLITPENVGEMMMVRSALGEMDLRGWRQRHERAAQPPNNLPNRPRAG